MTTPALGAPPLLNQAGNYFKTCPPQMRRGGVPSAGVVLNGQLSQVPTRAWIMTTPTLFS